MPQRLIPFRTTATACIGAVRRARCESCTLDNAFASRVFGTMTSTAVFTSLVMASLYGLSLAYHRIAFATLGALFVLTACLYQYGHLIRLALTTYAAVLLVSDEHRDQQKRVLSQWLTTNAQARDANALGLEAGGA